MVTRKAGKRGSGEGSIYRDNEGRWRSVVDLGWRDGRRRRKYLSGRTRAEVAGKLRRVLDEQEAGLEISTDGLAPTLDLWLTHWLDTIAAPRLRPSTLTTYRGYVRNRVVPNLGRHRLDKLQPEHLEALYAQLAADGLAPASILQIHRIVSRALKVAMQRGKIRRNVAALVQPPSVRREEVRPLTADQARAVLTAAQGCRNSARWSVALALGLRQGEALGLTWDAVDLDAATMTVRQALQRQLGGGLVVVPPKSRAGRRKIPMPDQLVGALRLHRAVQATERLAAGSMWTDSGMVFTGPTGKPVDPRADHREWQRLLRKACVPAARLHDARHTAATLLLAQGVPARVVMELLGHSQITLTLGTYTHVVPELARAAATSMGDALWG
jgi:integrase